MVQSQRRPLRINALLKSIYTDLRHPASFSSPYTLFRATKQKNPNILYKDVESWLETQPAMAQVGPANKRNDTKRCLPVEASLRPGEAVPW